MANINAPKEIKMNDLDTAFDPVAAALKQMHQSIANEKIPEDFFRILDEIDEKIAAAKAKQ